MNKKDGFYKMSNRNKIDWLPIGKLARGHQLIQL